MNAPNQVPTIGRRVYYWPSDTERSNRASYDAARPFDAGIVFVYTPDMVNLSVTDHGGNTYAATSVPFGAPRMEGGPYADWMPYQKSASHTPAPERSAS